MPAKTDQRYMIDRPRRLELDSDAVARLTRPQREARVLELMAEARRIYDMALNTLIVDAGKAYVGTCVLFSGGNDSTLLAHLARSWGVVDLAVHSNTGIGVEATREYVRKVCADWGWRLEERHPPTPYRDLVLEAGFPGPGQHFKMFQRLKERSFLTVRAELVTHSRRERLVYLGGRRRAESTRRAGAGDDPGVPAWEREGSLVWVSPLVFWTKPDMVTYRLMHDDMPRNPVSDMLHMSAECLCGAFAKVGEYDELAYWPVAGEVVAEIRALEAEVHARCREHHGGPIPHERTRWGWGAYRKDRNRLVADAVAELNRVGATCSTCA